MSRPLILVDTGPFPESTVGIGQVRVQYAAATMENRQSQFDFRFLVHPRDKDTRRTGVAVGKVRYSPSFIFRHMIDKEGSRFSRYQYTTQDHALRHIKGGHAFFQVPSRETAPLLYTLHDTHFFTRTEYAPATARNIFALVKRANALAFISKYTRTRAQEFLELDHTLQRTIYNGVNKPSNPHRPDWYRSNRPFLLCLSQIIPHKNYHVLAPVLKQLGDWNLIIAGKNSTPYAGEVEEAFRKAGARGRLFMPGNVSESEKAWLYEHCDALLHPALREGFGMPVLEAFHFGKPVFCSHNTALIEVGGRHACFWDQYDPEYLVRSIRDYLPHANENGRPAARQKWAARFSWRNNFRDYCDLYGEILESQKQPSRLVHVSGATFRAGRSGVRSARPARPLVLVDSGNSAKPVISGIGQVGLQYVRALVQKQPLQFDFRFLAHPKNRWLDAGPYDKPPLKSNAAYLLKKVLGKKSAHQTRHYYDGSDHALRHVLCGHAFFEVPAQDRAPIIWTAHDTFLLDPMVPENLNAQRIKALAQRADAIVFISDYTRRTVSRKLDLGDKLQSVIYNGVHKPHPPMQPPWFRQTRPFFLGLGQIGRNKNFHVLLNVMQEMPDYSLILAGKNTNRYARALMQQIKHRGMQDRVHMPGQVTDHEKAWLYQHCEALLHPSLREGFGMTVIEAFHFGKPVFCSRTTALREVGGRHAYFWDNYDPPYLLRTIRECLPTANENGRPAARRKWAERFSWKANIESYLDLYAHVLEKRKAAAE